MSQNLLKNILKPQTKDRSQLVEMLETAAVNGVIERDSVPIIESILSMDHLRAKDIMLPRYKVDVLDINQTMDSIVEKIIATGHSRFPVIDGEISKIIGIFHSKDLLKYFVNREGFVLRNELRQAYFVPEIKHLDGLMFEMRVRQSHMAIVVDEFTNVVGMITLEMIVEQIVGDIEDEHDLVESEREIIEVSPQRYRLRGYCKLQHLNQIVGTSLQDDSVETIGGFLIKLLKRVPIGGEVFNLDNLKIEVVDADSRKIKRIIVDKK